MIQQKNSNYAKPQAIMYIFTSALNREVFGSINTGLCSVQYDEQMPVILVGFGHFVWALFCELIIKFDLIFWNYSLSSVWYMWMLSLWHCILNGNSLSRSSVLWNNYPYHSRFSWVDTCPLVSKNVPGTTHPRALVSLACCRPIMTSYLACSSHMNIEMHIALCMMNKVWCWSLDENYHKINVQLNLWNKIPVNVLVLSNMLEQFTL